VKIVNKITDLYAYVPSEHVERIANAAANGLAPPYGTDWTEFIAGMLPAEVDGITIEVDPSRCGHAWTPIAKRDIPANVFEEIAAEILEGGTVEFYIASNGLHYRW
jgi:hypothetical protein